MRLVDADNTIKLLDEVLEEQSHGSVIEIVKKQLLVGFAKQVISDAPTIDAVPVVRCKDCVHASWRDIDGGVWKCKAMMADAYFGGDHFCAGGERRKDELN